ncbi:hypothetical protein [Streptomyces sp. KL118A]|uniref:hypothetical protein n=1 Tax=Streptomyces sp. KL118A TaxID=3045153 RepID=UPI00278C6626|nr:hypothetical protein [Streptomyces sp. KL118A]
MMRGYFADELLLMMPLFNAPGVRLWGEVTGAHCGPLALALTDAAARTDEIVLDLTDVQFVSNSILEILTVLARRFTPPRSLLVKAGAGLRLRERTTVYGWEQLATVRLEET